MSRGSLPRWVSIANAGAVVSLIRDDQKYLPFVQVGGKREKGKGTSKRKYSHNGMNSCSVLKA